MHSFSLGTTLYSGAGALDRLSALCGKRTFLVTDEYFARSGLADRVAARCGGQTEIFSQVTPEPTVELTGLGVARLQAFQPDTVVALGGGSVMDCAKGILLLSERKARLIAIPTTSGTGSEVTSFAVLTHAGVKQPLVDPALRPAAAILDAGLLDKLPHNLVAEAGMDAVSHCVEAAVANNASAFSCALAGCALEALLRLLPRSFRGDVSVRGTVHEAATMAGIAFDNAGLGLCHALAHAIGGEFHLAHGKLVAILLPHVVERNSRAAPGCYQSLAARCGLLGPRGLCSALNRLRRTLQLPATLTAAGLDPAAIQARQSALVQAALADPCLATNPGGATKEDCQAILAAALPDTSGGAYGNPAVRRH